MYLSIVIILNGVADIYRQHHHLNCHKAFSPQQTKGFYISTRIALGLLHTNAGTAFHRTLSR
jgi:hypothetical protein